MNKKKSLNCGFCDKEAIVTIAKFKNGFFMETYFCEEHSSSYRNKFLPNLLEVKKGIEDVLLYNSKEDFAFINEKTKKFCSKCDFHAESLLSTGFICCDQCLTDFFSHIKDAIYKKSTSSSLCKKRDIVDVDIVEEKNTKEDKESLFKELEKAIKHQDFKKAANLRDSILNLKRNEEARSEKEELEDSEQKDNID